MKHADAVNITGALGTRLTKEKTGWRDLKALLVVAGREDWNAAAALGDAMGVHPDDQERIFHDLQREARA